jgi:beta-glucosidase
MRGLQGDDPENLKAAACAKHYAVHSGPEKLRHVFDARPTMKDLFETYLPAFKLLVENGVEAVMGAYNRTLGEPCNGSEFLLKDILRGRWGFKGHVVSDCWAIRDFHENHKVTQTPEESAALALNCGCDLNCGCTYPMLTVSRKKGLVTEEAINTALERLLRTRFKLGMLSLQDEGIPPEQERYAKLGRETINCEKHRNLALESAEKSIVLLRNEADSTGKSLLPLDGSPKNILVTGPSAANPHTLMGNYYGSSPRMVTILEGLTTKMRDHFGIQVEYRLGCLQYEANHLSSVFFGNASQYDIIIAVFGLDGAMEGEEGDAIASDSNGDRDAIELPSWQLEYLRKLKDSGKKLILVLTGGSPIAFPEDIADAIIFAWYPGERGGEAVANIIFGDANPSGRLPITFPASTEQLPPYEDYSMKGRTYRYMEQKPLYPFGFGLSYTNYRYDKIEVSHNNISAGGSIQVKVQISNTGSRNGEEVVQLYIARAHREADDPLASLRAFKRVEIAAGKQGEAEFTLDAAAFETVNEKGESLLVPGEYTITAAGAAPLPVSLERGAAKPVSAGVQVN